MQTQTLITVAAGQAILAMAHATALCSEHGQVALNKHGMCPKCFMARAAAAGGSAQVTPPGGRTPRPPKQSMVDDAALKVGQPGEKYTCSIAGREGQPHGLVTLNRHGACPKCHVAAYEAAWAQRYAAQAAAAQEAAPPPAEETAPGTPDITSEQIEVQAKSPEPETATETQDKTATPTKRRSQSRAAKPKAEAKP